MIACKYISSARPRPTALSWVAGLVLGLSSVVALAQTRPGMFVDVAHSSGLDFVHFNGMSGKLYFPEMMGAGAALFDYDNDGDLDAYLVQGHLLGEGVAMAQAAQKPPHPLPLRDRLFRNDTRIGKDGAINIRFTDVTPASKLDAQGYGMGVAAADYDNDGWVDLYVMNYGANQLWHNRGDGTFENVTDRAGVGDARWSVSGSFVDVDADGLLDLYVGNYVKHNLRNRRECVLSNRIADYCGPLKSAGEKDRLYRNLGDGKFEDVAARAGTQRAWGGALGVITADYNADGHTDIYVANDGVPNQLWVNRGDGTFVDDALLAGVSVNGDGMAEASMGIDAADFDGDGDTDLFMTHLRSETNTLYVNDGNGWFEDETLKMGLANPSIPYTGFGMAWFDADNDGWLDLLAVNGAVRKIEALIDAGDPYPLHQRNQLFMNSGDGRYRERTAATGAGAVFDLSEVSRGAAFGDIDNDGDADVLVTNNAGPVRLLRNDAGAGAAWLGLRLLDGKRDALGARAVLQDGRHLTRRARSDGSYASANDARIIFGLGRRLNTAPKAPKHFEVNIIWPGGQQETYRGLAPSRYHTLHRGQGEKSPGKPEAEAG